jgi:predicted transcriptional regulator
MIIPSEGDAMSSELEDILAKVVHETIKAHPGGIIRDELAEELSFQESTVETALRALKADQLIFELSVGTVGGDRFASVD